MNREKLPNPARAAWIKRCASAICVVVAIFHASLILWPQLVHAAANDSALRHAVFVLINLAFAGLFQFAPRVAVAAMLPLVVQQAWSHGVDWLAARAETEARWDVRSAAVLVGLPVLWLMLIWAVRTPKRRADTSGN